MKNIRIKVKPNARLSKLELLDDGTWLAKIKAQPIDGKANEELIGLVAKHFNCRKADVIIKSGSSGRLKIIAIPDE